MTKALDRQIGGDHYKKYPIQPIEFCLKNNIRFLEGLVIKYVVRHRDAKGEEDVRKAIHLLEILLEEEYETALPNVKKVSVNQDVTIEKLPSTGPKYNDLPEPKTVD